MATYNLAAPAILTLRTNVVGEVGDEMFGAIFNNYFGFDRWIAQTSTVGLNLVRFPGGAVSEVGIVEDGRIVLSEGITQSDLMGDRNHLAFDLTHPELVSQAALDFDTEYRGSHNHIASFSDVVAAAVDQNARLGIVIPISRYFMVDDGKAADFTLSHVRDEAIQLAKSDVTTFLTRLKKGDFNNGVYPPSFSFEIGNELYYNPIHYAVIAKAVIDEISIQMEGSDIEFDIDVQAARGVRNYTELIREGYFDSFLSSPQQPIPGLENLQDLIRYDGLTRVEKLPILNQVIVSILGDSLENVGAVRSHILSFDYTSWGKQYNSLHELKSILDVWTEAYKKTGNHSDSLDTYISAWSTNSSTGSSTPYELAAAVNALSLFSHFVELGIDRAAIWGFLGDYSIKADSKSTIVSDVVSGINSPVAALLGLLSQNIDGAVLLSTGSNLKLEVADSDATLSKWGSKGSWVEQEDLNVGSSPTDYLMNVYQSEDRFVAFFAVGDIGTNELSLNVNLGLLSNTDFVGVTNLDLSPSETSGNARITNTVVAAINGDFDIEFDQSFEIVMVTIENSPGAGNQVEYLASSAGQLQKSMDLRDEVDQKAAFGDRVMVGVGDVISAFRIDSRVSFLEALQNSFGFDLPGANGGHFLIGTDANETVIGGDGNDRLSGDMGNDTLTGNAGFDVFVFTGGHDHITDFASGTDSIFLDGQRIPGMETHQNRLSSIMSTNVDGYLLTFDEANTLQVDVANGSMLSESDFFIV
ncbi:MAG: hypothetical protein AB8C02_12890 [Halioglobus sp.]